MRLNDTTKEFLVGPNPNAILRKLYPSPYTVPVSSLLEPPDEEQLKHFVRIGRSVSMFSESLDEAFQINFERSKIYKEIDKALLHWMVGGAAELYADVATNFNQTHNASVWITAKDNKYTNELNKLLDRIGIEERIFDWAYNTGAYGDLFVQVEAQPGIGVVAVKDDEHPINVSRVDVDGILVGFIRTPSGEVQGQIETNQDLLPPWSFVHFRVLGAKRKRAMYDDPLYAEYSMINMISQDARVISSSYGTSVLINALPEYKRLRLAEDSLLMARATRGPTKYIYKLKVDGTNIEAVDSLIDEYVKMLKRARTLDTSSSSPNYDSKYDTLGPLEDLIIPVWGDTNDLSIDKIGGDVDIKWIVDIEELRNRLASALRVPLSLLGGFTESATGALGSEAIEKLDIRFARTSRRLQRALRVGIARICQIHLAYMEMDPDPTLFEVNMSETSTAEEEQIKANLDTGVDVISKFMSMVKDMGLDVDREKLFNYLNQKILKLNDMDVSMFKPASGEEEATATPRPIETIRNGKSTKVVPTDLIALLPTKEGMGIWGKDFNEGKGVVKLFESNKGKE